MANLTEENPVGRSKYGLVLSVWSYFFYFCDKLVQTLVENIIDLNYFNYTVVVAVIKH